MGVFRILLGLTILRSHWKGERALPKVVGAWEVHHDTLHITYSFANNGTYFYQRYAADTHQQEQGSYVLRANRLILKPDGIGQRVLRWRIGPDPATAGLSGIHVLFLQYPDGRKEAFHPKRRLSELAGEAACNQE